jgi:hypothetical protein
MIDRAKSSFGKVALNLVKECDVMRGHLRALGMAVVVMVLPTTEITIEIHRIHSATDRSFD